MKYRATYISDRGEGAGETVNLLSTLAAEIAQQLVLNEKNNSPWPLTIMVDRVETKNTTPKPAGSRD